MASIEFRTTEYQFSHGHAPRGRGSWAFAYARNVDIDAVIWVHGTYAEAKKVMRARAKADGKTEVWVCS